MYNQNDSNNCERQKHVHEITGSTETITECRECHNHRFCTVSGEAMPVGKTHVHVVKFHTDFAAGQFPAYCGKTTGASAGGNGKHVHFLKDFTEEEDGHKHKFQFATLIDSPIDFKHKD